MDTDSECARIVARIRAIDRRLENIGALPVAAPTEPGKTPAGHIITTEALRAEEDERRELAEERQRLLKEGRDLPCPNEMFWLPPLSRG
jgi:hypothetical protein